MEEERGEQKERAAAEKRTALYQLADVFEAEVLDVVRTVATAASQLQENANLMNAAAGETDRQSKLVAAAAEQAIEGVRNRRQFNRGPVDIGRRNRPTGLRGHQDHRQRGVASRLHHRDGARSRDCGRAHRPGHRADQCHRVANQPLGAQRDHRSRPCG